MHVLHVLSSGPLIMLHSPCPHSCPITRPQKPFLRVPMDLRLVGWGVTSLSYSCSISRSHSVSLVPSSYSGRESNPCGLSGYLGGCLGQRVVSQRELLPLDMRLCIAPPWATSRVSYVLGQTAARSLPDIILLGRTGVPRCDGSPRRHQRVYPCAFERASIVV